MQPTRVEIALQHFGKSRFVERHLAAREHLDLARIDVDTEHLMAQFGHACRMGRAEISTSEDRDPHVRSQYAVDPGSHQTEIGPKDGR
ncbi:hypothetical protein GCM10007298_06130 [Williamsia phyllosphaerae]|uniref:Uncharacterized protein n=1 Tax=Williamsia phyllosphaerae TaxID=885042 RepID=A0ABQ1U866_9NOCA|nr:hypothetical protein GCM10007298_06130 [Williamsia phyllosphaerae]